MTTQDDEAAVRAANQAFYDAHEGRDLVAMVACWEHSDRVVCIHPGWPILRGWARVEESWRRILHGPGRNQFILTNEEVVAYTAHARRAGVPEYHALVNSTYRRTTDGWRLAVHQQTPF